MSDSSNTPTNPLVLPTDHILSSLLLKVQNNEYQPTTSTALTSTILKDNGLIFQDSNVPKLLALAGDMFIVDIINRSISNRDIRLTGLRNDLKREKIDAINTKRKRERERLLRKSKAGSQADAKKGKKSKKEEKKEEEEGKSQEEEDDEEKKVEDAQLTNEEIALYKYHKNTLNVKDLVGPLKCWGVDVSHM